MWIRLTTIEGEKHLFNTDNIFRIYTFTEDGGGTFIDTVCTGLYGKVKETPDEILSVLKTGEWPI